MSEAAKISIKVDKIRTLKGYICGDCGSSQNIILAKITTIDKTYSFGAVLSETITSALCKDCYSLDIHKACPDCQGTIFETEEDTSITCKKCGCVLAASIRYVKGEKIDLPWGILLKRTNY